MATARLRSPAAEPRSPVRPGRPAHRGRHGARCSGVRTARRRPLPLQAEAEQNTLLLRRSLPCRGPGHRAVGSTKANSIREVGSSLHRVRCARPVAATSAAARLTGPECHRTTRAGSQRPRSGARPTTMRPQPHRTSLRPGRSAAIRLCPSEPARPRTWLTAGRLGRRSHAAAPARDPHLSPVGRWQLEPRASLLVRADRQNRATRDAASPLGHDRHARVPGPATRRQAVHSFTVPLGGSDHARAAPALSVLTGPGRCGSSNTNGHDGCAAAFRGHSARPAVQSRCACTRPGHVASSTQHTQIEPPCSPTCYHGRSKTKANRPTTWTSPGGPGRHRCPDRRRTSTCRAIGYILSQVSAERSGHTPRRRIDGRQPAATRDTEMLTSIWSFNTALRGDPGVGLSSDAVDLLHSSV
jgi:hypothetical protein